MGNGGCKSRCRGRRRRSGATRRGAPYGDLESIELARRRSMRGRRWRACTVAAGAGRGRSWGRQMVDGVHGGRPTHLQMLFPNNREGLFVHDLELRELRLVVRVRLIL